MTSMIRKYYETDCGAVEHHLRIGLEEQVRHADASVPPEDDNVFATEWAERVASLEREPEAWTIATDDSDTPNTG